MPLPGDRCSVVWVAPPKEAERLMVLSDDELSEAAGKNRIRSSGASVEGGRHLFPLAIERPANSRSARMALVGEAAHVVPPMGAQGLNLGLARCRRIAAIVREALA